MSIFWKRWLTVWTAAVGMFGVVLGGAAFAATSGPVEALLRALNPAGRPEFDPALRFAVALMGCVTLGWGATVYAAMRAAWRMGPQARPLWLGLTAAISLWFVTDSTLSIATGFGLNAVSNAAFFAAFLFPVWRSGVIAGGGSAQTATARA